MKRIKLAELANQYPTIESYIKHSTDTIRLEGIYPDKNVIYFKISPIGVITLDSIAVIEGTSFNFILAITNGDSLASNAKLFTSQYFKSEIQKSIDENNPYFIRDALKIPYLIHYSLTNNRKLVNNLSTGKLPNGSPELDSDGNQIPANQFVSISKYNFINSNGTVDYTKLVKYIDWVVSTPVAISEIDTNNVLPINKILSDSDYTKTSFQVPQLPSVISGDSYGITYTGGSGVPNSLGGSSTSGGAGGTATGGSNNGAGGNGNGTGVTGGNPADTVNPTDKTPDTGVGPKNGYQL